MNAEERIAELLGESTADFEAERLILNATELILELMEHEGLTRSELAERIGKSKGHVSQLLNGERNMTLRTLAEIAHAVGHRIELGARSLASRATTHEQLDAPGGIFEVLLERSSPYPMEPIVIRLRRVVSDMLSTRAVDQIEPWLPRLTPPPSALHPDQPGHRSSWADFEAMALSAIEPVETDEESEMDLGVVA